MEKYFENLIIPDNIKRIRFDVGLGRDAINSVRWLANNNDLFVFMFDPNPDSIISTSFFIKNALQIFPSHISTIISSPNYSMFPIGLSNVTEQTSMEFYGMQNDCGTSSLFEPVKDSVLGPVKQKIQVPVYSLKHVFDLFPWERFPYIEYVKIDAQGSDFNIIKGMGDYLKERVIFISAEADTGCYIGDEYNNLNDISNYLKTLGFVRIVNPCSIDPTFINLNLSIKHPHFNHKL